MNLPQRAPSTNPVPRRGADRVVEAPEPVAMPRVLLRQGVCRALPRAELERRAGDPVKAVSAGTVGRIGAPTAVALAARRVQHPRRAPTSPPRGGGRVGSGEHVGKAGARGDADGGILRPDEAGRARKSTGLAVRGHRHAVCRPRSRRVCARGRGVGRGAAACGSGSALRARGGGPQRAPRRPRRCGCRRRVWRTRG